MLATRARFAHYERGSLQRIATVTQHIIFFIADAPVSSQWIACAVALGATAFVLFRPRMKAKADPLSRSPVTMSLAQQRAVERQMQNLLVELSEMARKVTAGLDTRAAKLDLLIREADEKIAALSAMQSSITLRPARDAQPSNPMVIAPAPPPPCPYEPDPRHLEVYTLADQGMPTRQIAAELQRPAGEIELILALRPRKTG